MYATANVLDLISQIYDSVARPELWQAFLEGLNVTMGNIAATLHIHDFSTQTGKLLAEVGLDKSFNTKYEAYYAQRNILMSRGRNLLVAGNIVTSDQICSDSEFVRTEYYNDYLLPQKVFYLGGGSIIRRDDFAAIISAARPKSRPFSSEDRRLFKVLMPHLQRALQFHRQLSSVQFERQAAIDALDMLPLGFVLVTAQAKIIFANRAAHACLGQADGLRSEHGMLRPEKLKEGNLLRQMITQVSRTSSGAEMHPGGVLSVTRSGERVPLSLLVCPVRFEDVAICLADQPGAAIFITDPESQHKPDWQILGSLFGLTTAEARLTILLLQGHTLKEAADQIKVTINTVHSQLKSVFAKTGANRQADLMRILLTGPAQLHFRSHSADSLPRTSGLNT